MVSSRKRRRAGHTSDCSDALLSSESSSSDDQSYVDSDESSSSALKGSSTTFVRRSCRVIPPKSAPLRAHRSHITLSKMKRVKASDKHWQMIYGPNGIFGNAVRESAVRQHARQIVNTTHATPLDDFMASNKAFIKHRSDIVQDRFDTVLALERRSPEAGTKLWQETHNEVWRSTKIKKNANGCGKGSIGGRKREFGLLLTKKTIAVRCNAGWQTNQNKPRNADCMSGLKPSLNDGNLWFTTDENEPPHARLPEALHTVTVTAQSSHRQADDSDESDVVPAQRRSRRKCKHEESLEIPLTPKAFRAKAGMVLYNGRRQCQSPLEGFCFFGRQYFHSSRAYDRNVTKAQM